MQATQTKTKIGQAYRERLVQDGFDAIVIGSGMGGLSAASMLSQAGKRVLLLEQHNVIGGCTQTYSRRGYEWNVGLHYIGDVHSERTMTWRLFDSVTRGALNWNALPEVYNRIALGERVYDVHAGPEAYTRRLKEYFPRETDAIDRHMELVGAMNRTSQNFFAERGMSPEEGAKVYAEYSGKFREYSDRTTLEVLRELTADSELIAVLCGNWGDYGLEPSKSSFAMHAMLFRHYLNGGAYPVGGAGTMAQSIVPIIEQAGGRVLYGAKVEEIMIRNGKAAGVKLAGGDEIMADIVVSNAGAENTFQKLVPEDTAHELGLPGLIQTVRTAATGVGLNAGLSKTAAELGFQTANIWSHPSRDFDANIANHLRDFNEPFPIHFITFASAKDPTWEERHPGTATVELFAGTHFKFFEKWRGTRWNKRGADYEDFKKQIGERLLGELYRFAPQAEGALDYFEVNTPLSYEHFLNRPQGGFMGLEASPQRFQQRWLRPHTPVKDLYLTGQDITTDGIIGALMGGVMCASSILERNLMSDIARKRYKSW